MTSGKEIVWVVTPHESSEFDEWWGRARDLGTNDDDAHAALEYAQDRLESLWDQLDMREGPATVSIEQREVESWETPWSDEEPEA